MILEVDKNTFEAEVLQAEGKVLVDYYGDGWTYIREYIEVTHDLAYENEWHIWKMNDWDDMLTEQQWIDNIDYFNTLLDKALLFAETDEQKTEVKKVIVQIRFIDDDGQRHAEMAAEVGHAGEVVAAGGGGFHHAHGKGRAGKRGDDGASHAGRAVAEYGFQLLLTGALAGFGLEQAHQLAGILLSGEELGMHHLAEAGVAHVPVAAMAFGEVDGLRGAELHADAASLTAQGIDLVYGAVEGDGLEGAELPALAAVHAVGLAYLGFVAGDEGLGLLHVRVEQDVQVGRVHVKVADDLVLGKVGEGRAHRGLAGAALAADDDYLPHGGSPSRGRIRHAGHRAGQ